MSSEDKIKKGLNRREFLRGSAITAVGIASGGLLAGCTKDTAAPASQAPAGNPEPAANKASFETPPKPIPDSEIKETVTTDVVVVGAGVGGLMAAFAATKAGAKTVLIEKHTTFTYRGGHNGAVGTKFQEKQGIKIDKSEVVSDLMRFAGNKVDTRLLMLWADKSGGVMDILVDLAEAQGIKMSMYDSGTPDLKYPEYKTGHIFGTMADGQKNLTTMLEAQIKAKGGEIRYSTPAVQLIKDGNGRITGVIAGAEGKYVKLNASKGVILCTGDYGHDDEMMKRYNPRCLNVNTNVYLPKTNTGDGHKMGLWVGAAMDEDFNHVPMSHNLGVGPMGSDAFLRVNGAGLRYENEDVNEPLLVNGIQAQPGRIAWTIYDANFPEDCKKMGGGFSRESKVTETTLKNLQAALNNKSAFKANTIEELAQLMGVSVDNLKATIERYNELAKGGKDLDFGKRGDRLTKIEKAPFYAIKQPTSLLIALGGLKVNPKLQVLNKEGKVIPGLYAVGNTSGQFFSNDYPNTCPGLSHGRAITFGYLAGQNAVSEK